MQSELHSMTSLFDFPVKPITEELATSTANPPITSKIPDQEDIDRTSRFGELFPFSDKPVRLLLWVRDQPVQVEFSDEIIIGWAHPASPHTPDVDLAPYEARQSGVSRCHIKITRSDELLRLEDLGSTNGTQLNGLALFPDQPVLLRDGDQLHLGQLAIRVAFNDSEG